MADIIVNFAPCFYYTDPANGDIVKSGPIQGYVQRVAIAVCSLIQNINTQQSINKDFNDRISTLENKPTPTFTLPSLYPQCISSSTTLLRLDQFVALLEQSFCEMSSALGTSTAIFNAITTPPSDFNHSKALGTTGGTLGELAGWILDPKNLTDSTVNIWLTLIDLRSAVRNIQVNCCNTSCGGIAITLTGTLENKILKLYFSGTIPSNLVSCVSGGSQFKISDQSGNSLTAIVDIQGNMNNISGVSIDLSSTPLNFADDFDVRAITCFSDPDTGTVCQNCLEIIVDNNSNCPTVTLVPGSTSITFSFVHVSGTLTYSVQLVDSTNTIIQSFNESVSAPITVSGVFSGLIAGALYRVRVQMITPNNTKTCPFTAINTLPNPCAPPNGISVTIAY